MKFLIILLLLITYVQSAEKQKTISIDLKIYDQLPKYNHNFGVGVGGITKNMVNKMLGANNLPTLTTDPTILQNGKISSPNLFQDFFYTNTDFSGSKSTNTGLNYPLVKKINLELGSDQVTYKYSSVTSFYPIEYSGFDVNPDLRINDETYTYHNNYYCFSFNYKFPSVNRESIFKFTANDDTWIFLDDTLVVDMGGSHNSGAGFIDFKNIILEERKSHSIDFFTCERNGVASPFTIETTLGLDCYGLEDYCGVCRGDGGTCCNLNRGDCGAEDLCIVRACPELSIPRFVPPESLKNACRHSLKYNPKPDQCTLVTCSPLNGQLVYNNSVCFDKTQECQVYTKCDPVNGCQYQSKCNEICHSSICDGKGGCLAKETNGSITAPAVNCFGCNVCDVASGECTQTHSICNDSNICTEDICLKDGTCSYQSSNHCDKGDKCKVYTCSNDNGCSETDRICPDDGECQIGYCEAGFGCKLKAKECHSDYFCLEATCDDQYGCVISDRKCKVDDDRCEAGICVNNTAVGIEDGKCITEEYDPKPFICKTAAVVSTAVVAGVVVPGAVALVAFVYGGKKGYDYWKNSQGNAMTSASQNPLYVVNPNGGDNPLFVDNT